MKLTICQFGKLFLLLTAFLFANKSLKAVVAVVVVAGNVVVDVVERDIERKSEQTQERNQQLQQQQQPPPPPPHKQLTEPVEKEKQQYPHPRTHPHHILGAEKQLINNTFNSFNKTTQIENGHIQVSGNQAAATITIARITTTATSNSENGSLTDVVDNHVAEIDPTSSTATTSPSVVAATPTELSMSAHVTDLMRRQNVSHDFLLQQKHKRTTSNQQQQPKQTGRQQQPEKETESHQRKHPHQPQLLLPPSYSPLTAAAASSSSSSSSPPSTLSLSSQYNQQSQQQQHQKVHSYNNNPPSPPATNPFHTMPVQQPLVAAETKERNERVGILMPSHLVHRMHVQQGFYNFVEFFQVNLNNVIVDFIPDDDLTTFIKLLEQPNYTTVVKTLNDGINLDDDDLREGVSNSKPTALKDNENETMDERVNVADESDNNISAQERYPNFSSEKEQSQQVHGRREEQPQPSLTIAYCPLAKALQRDFNKTVLLWPCPHMKEASTSRKGRPNVSYEEGSMRTKRRRVEELVASTSSEALKKATERLTGSNTNEKISVESALALYIDMDLSMRQYNMMRKVVNSIHKDCFPSYYMIAEAKKKVLPDDIQLTESSAEVPLQKILDKTVRSILDVNDIDTNNDIVLECKWGFDSSSGHSVYKQKFQDEEASEEFMFVTSFVPLRLLDWADDQIVWENDRHSSWRLCRPLKIIFTKENASVIQSVRDSINTEIEGLFTYNYISKNKNLNVHYKMQLTMIDGAVLNVLSGNSSSSSCALCGAKPSEMNSLSIFERPVNEQCYQYGLSTLHAWIKCFECILHISYKQPIKKWRVVGEEDKDQVAEQKRSIQAKFKSEMGLIVDKVKTGYGTTNDGNTARRFFSNVELSAQITNVDESSNFLPSYEAISFAVKSIATKLNWTQVDIFVGDENWALPMAIASNMHIPYKIEIGEDDIRDLNAEDNFGKAIIITAAMNDDSTLRLLSQLEYLMHTKVLLIDIVATSFNAENRFYKYLTRINPDSALMSNLLLLTVLSDNYRHFLNVAFDDNGIELVQNFRQKRRWKEAGEQQQQPIDWPMHLDKSVAKVLQMRETTADAERETETTTAHVTPGKLQSLNEWLTRCPFVNESRQDLNEICLNYKQCLDYDNVTAGNVSAILDDLCHTRLMKNAQHLIEKLRSFIDFFNFYDFLIANILTSNVAKFATGTPSATNTSSKPLINESKHVPKYDFIVLDVVRRQTVDTTSHISATESSTNPSHIISGRQEHLNIITTTNTTTTGNANKNRNLENSSPPFNANATNSATPTTAAERSAAFKWRPLLILEQHEINWKTYITHSIRPGYDDWLLVSTAQLWQCGSICWTIIAICAAVLVIIVVASVAAGITMRNYLLRKRLSKGPNKIVLSANDFVFPVDSRRVDEGIEAMLCCWLQQLQEFGGPEVDKPDLLKGSIGSLKNLGFLIPGATGPTNITGLAGKTGSGSASLARHNPALLDMRARYNGDLVQLKEVSLNGSTELKSKAMDLLVMAHGLRHENINPLIGWLADPNRTAMVFDYCSRGSLQDVLIMDEIKLDWSFRLSLLTDLVRGMRYLHTSPLRVHGTLTSRNCVVDARWVLKITDYGLPIFCEAQGLQPVPRTAKEMLWCAPELLRSMKPQQQHHHHHHHHQTRVVGTPAGDVYSFGIIMQEVVVRGEPYCMLSLSAEEIIAKIKKPPPLIRPSVSKGAAPPEAINIMRQCWAEQPEMRPDFNSVYERFKLLNHGRKVNFVDTMFQMLEKYSNNLEELIRERTDQLDIERKKTEQLLNRMLPNSVAEKLKMGLAVEPEEFSDVTIYFSDIVGFTTIAAHCTPVQVVDLLNDLYTIFDATINAYNVYKVETIGDAYMVVSGLPVRIPDHADQIATMALDLLHQSGRFNVKHLPGVPLQLRIGLHTGPCCAGVVGLTMPRYCLFGDTVNTASRMESTGSSWRIHMSQETRNRLEARGGYMIEPRGLIDIKGKGMMNTFWLLGKKGFDKPMPNPPPIGLDESLIRNSITLKAQANKSRNSTNPSSSQSSSLAGESVEVKVEITPPANIEVSSSNLANSYSLDSNSTTTISPNMTLCPDFPTKTPSTSPQLRKISDLATDNLLNPNNFNRLPSSTAGSSSRLYKKLEEIMDLSSPYNHYKCLSPSESNLTQFYDGKYVYSAGTVPASAINSISLQTNTARFEKPGSSRLLRRQFSLDRDDTHSKSEHQHQQHHQSSLQSTHPISMSNKSSMLEIPILHDTSRSPKGTINRIHKQNSNSIAQDLEKIEEIPLSPASSQQHSSLDSNMNRSPPSTVEAPSPSPPPTIRGMVMCGMGVGFHSSTSPPCTLLSAPASPAPSRSINGNPYNSTIMESPTTDASSTATTTASVNSNTTAPSEDQRNLRNTEITLNVEALLSR